MSKGVVLSLVASVLFGVLYFYTTLLAPLSGEEIFGWRMLLTLPCVTAFMLYAGDWPLVAAIARRVRLKPMLALGLLASAALLAMQLWLFMWAPLHGRGLQVSLGYFLLPLTMIVAGRLIYRERLSRLRWLATFCAALGVANQFHQLGGFSWETLLVAFGYPVYFVFRRQLGTANLGGLWYDMTLMAPLALWFALDSAHAFSGAAANGGLVLLIPLLGLLSACALVCYILSSRLLSLSLFGLLGYVEPVLLVLVALLLGESIQPQEWPTYIAIWLAVALLVVEGGLHLLGRRRAL